MAGAGFKDFAVGEVLTASDVDTYLMQQSVMRFADAAARGSALGTATGTAVPLAEGMVTYLDDTNYVQVYNGTGWTSAIPGVGVNVVQTVKTDVFTASVAASSRSGAAISATITPSSATAKILVLATMTLNASDDGVQATAELFAAGSLVTAYIGDAASSRQRRAVGSVDSAQGFGSGNMVFLHSPGTTSAVTYDVRLSHQSSVTRTVYMNRTRSDLDSANGVRTASTLTLIEVAA